jgi:4'-phosphopantetheinyl transferase
VTPAATGCNYQWDSAPAQLWCASVAAMLGEVGVRADMSWLSAEETARLASISAPRRREQFLAGRWLARLALVARHGGAVGDWQLSAKPDAPPGILASPVTCTSTIGLTHSGDTVACVIADIALGIDLERHDRRRLDVFALSYLVFTDAERRHWLALPQALRQGEFLSWWTLKEAWIKSQCRGLDPAAMQTIEALPVPAALANARLWREPGFTLALVGLPARRPLGVATSAPGVPAQWWRVGELKILPPTLATAPATCP